MNENETNAAPIVPPTSASGCSAALVWMRGPANGGGGTAGIIDGVPNWWDGDLLLVVVETNAGRDVSAVRVSADGPHLSFVNAGTGDDDFGWGSEDIAWWAKLDGCLPPNPH
jgi:hypothetical protein